MKYLVSLKGGLVGVSSRGTVLRLWKDAASATYRNDAGSAIPWIVQWGQTSTSRAGTKTFVVETQTRTANPARGWRVVTLHRDGLSGAYFGHYTASGAEALRALPIPVRVLAGWSVETGFAARSAEVMLLRLTQELNAEQGGQST